MDLGTTPPSVGPGAAEPSEPKVSYPCLTLRDDAAGALGDSPAVGTEGTATIKYRISGARDSGDMGKSVDLDITDFETSAEDGAGLPGSDAEGEGAPPETAPEGEGAPESTDLPDDGSTPEDDAKEEKVLGYKRPKLKGSPFKPSAKSLMD